MNSPLLLGLYNLFNEQTKGFIKTHPILSKDIENEMVRWQEDASRKVRRAALSHFAKEASLIEQVKTGEPQSELSVLSKTKEQYERLASVIEDNDNAFIFDPFIAKSSELFHNRTDDFRSDIEAIHYSLGEMLSNNLDQRRSAYEKKLLNDKMQAFIVELSERIWKYQQIEKTLQPIFEFFNNGLGWDTPMGALPQYGFETLRYYASVMRNSESIAELAKMLGRHGVASSEAESEMLVQIETVSAYHPRYSISGDLIGLEYSGDINRIVPSETSTLNSPDTEMLFYSKLVEKKLLSYSYLSREGNAEAHKQSQSEEKKDPCGPIIACIDTSGSMAGKPEIAAKTLLLAIAKEAILAKRKCYIISFSDRIETIELSNWENGIALQELVAFLCKSFHGGTDAYPAFCEAIKVLQETGYQNSDVIMASDFIMPIFPHNLVLSIEQQKAKGTNFYSFKIGSFSNTMPSGVFTNNFNYDPYSEKGRKSFADAIRLFAQRKTR